jgi:protein transport protein DSL1/ZW10
MSLIDAVIGLKAYKEVDKRMAVLWNELDQVLIRPRTAFESEHLPAIRVENVKCLVLFLEILLTFCSHLWF